MNLTLNISTPPNTGSVDSFILSKLQTFCENYIFLYTLLNNGNLYLKTYPCFLEGYVEMAYSACHNNLISKEQFSQLLDIPLPRTKSLLDLYSKEYSSKPKSIKRELDSLTNNLLFTSESSYPFTVELITPCRLLNLDFSQYHRQDFFSFFAPLFKEESWFDSSELTTARRYLSLYNYLESKFRNLYVFSRSLTLPSTEKYTEVIICGECDNLVVLLKTKAIYS
jgi:hypothetical protein